MKYQSFGLGVVSGMLILGVVMFGVHIVRPTPTFANRNGFTQGQNGGGTQNLSRMAQRLGMSEADLQKELDSGKTMQQIFQEHGVTFQRRNGQQGGSGTTTGSGAVTSTKTATGATSSSSSL